MSSRRDFLKTMLTALGTAAVARPLTQLAAGELRAVMPPTAKLAQLPGNLFWAQKIVFRNNSDVAQVPRLLIGEWELDSGLKLLPGCDLFLTMGPNAGYQLDPVEEIALMGRGMMVALHGFRIPHHDLVPPGGEAFIENPFTPYTYFLRV